MLMVAQLRSDGIGYKLSQSDSRIHEREMIRQGNHVMVFEWQRKSTWAGLPGVGWGEGRQKLQVLKTKSEKQKNLNLSRTYIYQM